MMSSAGGPCPTVPVRNRDPDDTSTRWRQDVQRGVQGRRATAPATARGAAFRWMTRPLYVHIYPQRDDVTASPRPSRQYSRSSSEAVWLEATPDERRVLVQELVEEFALFADHLEGIVAVALRLHVTLEEGGVQNASVRGGT